MDKAYKWSYNGWVRKPLSRHNNDNDVSEARLMKNLMFAGVITVMATMLCSCANQKSNDVAQLNQRIDQLEKQVQEMSQVVEPLKAQQIRDNRRAALHEQFTKKLAEDSRKYSPEQLSEAEQLYQVANQKWGSDEATESLQTMIKKYPDINRTGCAVLYVAQMSQGDDRGRYLQDCIQKYNDCYYGDGVQVGAFARFLLAQDYRSKGDQSSAARLSDEIRTRYAEAIDHSGNLLVDGLKTDSK